MVYKETVEEDKNILIDEASCISDSAMSRNAFSLKSLSEIDQAVWPSLVSPILVVAQTKADHQKIEDAFRDLGVENTVLHTDTCQMAKNYILNEGLFDKHESVYPSFVVLEMDMITPAVEELILAMKRAKSQLRRVPIIVMYADQTSKITQRLYGLGANVVMKSAPDFMGFYNILQKTTHFWMYTAVRADTKLPS